MRSAQRTVLRVLALLGLLAVLIGVPVMVARTIGLPVPSWHQWRIAMSSRRVDTDFVVRLGACIFVLLWSWFAITAIAEFGRVWLHRREPSALPAVDRADGPAWWVRGLVRFIAISSVSATALMGGIGAVHGVAGAAPHEHVVAPGDSYWRIAQDHLSEAGATVSMADVHALTLRLVQHNSARLGHRDATLLLPGEVVRFETPAAAVRPVATVPVATVPVTSAPTSSAPASTLPTATPPPATVAPVPSTVAAPTLGVAAPTAAVPSNAAPTVPTPTVAVLSAPGPSNDHTAMVILGLSGAAMLAGGAVRILDARRRSGWRGASLGTRAAVPSFEQIRTELCVRAIGAEEQLVRLDVVLRAVARDIAAQGAAVLMATISSHGDVRLFLRGTAMPSDLRWRLQLETGAWLLPGSVTLGELADAARTATMPCPALLHLGAAEDGSEVYADLEAMGVLGLDSPAAASILRTAAGSLIVSPFRETSTLLATGMTLSMAGIDCIDDPSDALATAVAASAGMVMSTVNTNTFALRSLGKVEDSWDPVLLLSGVPVGDDTLGAIGGGRGLGVLAVGSVQAPYVLRAAGGAHVLEPFGLRITPVSIADDELDAIANLLEAPSVSNVDVDEADAPSAALPLPVDPLASTEPCWDWMVKVLGQLEVVDRSGRAVQFERSKSLELVVWLSQHRERPTRSAARAALWDLSVRDATFANVVSDARRAMGRTVAPPVGEEWIARTLTEALPLHPRVVTDAELLQAQVKASRSLPPWEAVAMLRPGLEALSGMPFADTTYLWTDAEGHTSALVLLATGAAIEMANHSLALGDVDGVFWATGQGLRVLPGHEELIALRMRAHASRGDLSGVRQEWESYERALASEPWSSNEPAPKLAALRRELLSAPAASART